MCTWFYAEKATLSPIITKVQQLPLANTIRPSRIAKKALTNMVMEKAVEYPEPKPEFMKI